MGVIDTNDSGNNYMTIHGLSIEETAALGEAEIKRCLCTEDPNSPRLNFIDIHNIPTSRLKKVYCV